MRLFVMGATGGIGRLVVQQGLARGLHVTAFVRSPENIALRSDRLNVVRGDPRRAEEIAAAVNGHDAIISSLGPRSSSDVTLLEDAARATVDAMRRTEIRRLLVVSVAFLFPETGLPGTLLRKFILKKTGEDAVRMETLLQQTDVDWTVARPPRLTNGALTGKYRVLDGHLPPRGFLISRADVADFLLEETEKPGHVREIVGVCK
jgi:putative NADH-flavin reductase